MPIGALYIPSLPITGGRRPALNLNFLSGVLDPRITFTRASSGTFVGSNGLIQSAGNNIPRFDYDPSTLAARGLLIEEQRTNLLQRSEEFDNAYWGKFGGLAVTANQTTAPDGTVTADQTSGGAPGGIFVLAIAPTGTSTLSVFAKQSANSVIDLGADTGSNGYAASFNLAAGIVGAPYIRGTGGTVSAPSATITAYPNGWYKCTFTFTSSATEAISFLNITGSIFMWGAQLEVGAFATSYIPTVAASATRSRDVAAILSPDSLAIINQGFGTLYAKAIRMEQSSFGRVLSVNDGTSGNEIYITNRSGTGEAYSRKTASTSGDITGNGSWLVNTVGKIALAYGPTNYMRLCTNNGTVTGDATVDFNTVSDRITLGCQSGGNVINGWLQEVRYYRNPLPDSVLKALTT